MCYPIGRVATIEPALHALGDRQVNKPPSRGKRGQERKRQRDETEPAADRGIGQPYSHWPRRRARLPRETGLGRLRSGLPRVRMTKMTSTWVASDSMNQPVRKSAAAAWKTREQEAEGEEVEERADRAEHQHEARMKRMSQRAGGASSSASTSSSGDRRPPRGHRGSC